jgi:hypothetical protein
MFIEEQIKTTFIMVSERNFKQNTWNTLTLASRYLPVCIIQVTFQETHKILILWYMSQAPRTADFKLIIDFNVQSNPDIICWQHITENILWKWPKKNNEFNFI